MKPINPGSDTPTVSTSSSAAGPVGTSQSQGAVASGFHGDNSMSIADNGGGQGVNVALDAPEKVHVAQRDLMLKAFDAKLDSFRARVRDFNRKFDAEIVDINDSQALLMLVKGMLSETQAMVSVVSIDQNYSSRSLVQEKKQKKAGEALELRQFINTRRDEIAQNRQSLDDKSWSLTQKKTSKNLKEHQLSNSRDVKDFDRAAELTSQLQLLGDEIANITVEIAALNQKIQEQQAQNVADKGRVRSLDRTLNSTIDEFVNVRNLLERIRQRFDQAVLETSEEGVVEVKELDKKVQIEQNRESRKRNEQKTAIKRVGQEQLEEADLYADNAQDRELGVNEFLTKEDQRILQQVFGVQDANDFIRIIDELDSLAVDEPFPPAEEGLAIALKSTLKGISDERVTTPAAEKQYGDSLSFEGATNPQIFSRLWMEAKLREGENTQEVKEAHLDESADNIERHRQSASDALQEFKDIPLEAADAHEKQREAAIQIQRNSRA